MIHQKIKLYPDRDDVTLTSYVLSDSPELLNGKNRPAVAAIIAYGIGDYFLTRVPSKDPGAAMIRKAAAIAYLGSENADDELMHKVSPVAHVSEKTPPMFLWCTG